MSPPHIACASNNAWANRTLHGALTPLSREAFMAKRPGFFPSLAATLNHIYEVDLYYIDALTEGGLGRSVYDRDDIHDAAELGTLQAASDARLLEFCMGLADADLDRRVETERQDGMTTETIGNLLPHLFQHQVHHRGQAHVQLQDAGIDPPQLDDFFLEYGRVPTADAYPR
jgi:uncharacterized damage-inducible protein DinB